MAKILTTEERSRINKLLGDKEEKETSPMLIKKTKQYDIFNFREDNRDKIDQGHVQRLIQSIKARNLLELRPICVNGKMEVIDGQHRLLAAKALDVEIYYQMDKGLTASDVILMNVAKAWSITDYLNFYVKNEYEEYKKLDSFIKKNKISLRIALTLIMGQGREVGKTYRDGEFKFIEENFGNDIETCWETIDYVKKMNGFSGFTMSSRFWKCLIKLVRHAHFNKKKWFDNLPKMIERFTPKATTEDYMRLFMEVHNWRNDKRVNLLDDEI